MLSIQFVRNIFTEFLATCQTSGAIVENGIGKLVLIFESLCFLYTQMHLPTGFSKGFMGYDLRCNRLLPLSQYINI